MIITERKADDGEFLFAPIYFLTGDLETAKFYSNLASATAKFGTYLEHKIKEFVSLPVIEYDEILQCKQKSLLLKQKISGVMPDFVIVNPIDMTIQICEVKSNLFNMDSKQCKTENNTGEILMEHFSNYFPEFKSEIYLVNFFGFQPSNRGKHILGMTDNFQHINGQEFSDVLEIDYQEVLVSLKNDRKVNQDFISSYKNKPIGGQDA